MDKFDNELKELLEFQLDNEGIFVSEDLIQKTLQRVREEYVITNPQKNRIPVNIPWRRIFTTAAVFIIMFFSYMVFSSKFSMKNNEASDSGYVSQARSNNKNEEHTFSSSEGIGGSEEDLNNIEDVLNSSGSLSATADSVQKESTSNEMEKGKANEVEANDMAIDNFTSKNQLMLYENIDLQKAVYDKLTDIINYYSMLVQNDDLLGADGKLLEGSMPMSEYIDIITGNDTELLYYIYFAADTWNAEIAIYDSAYIYVCYTGSKESEHIYKIQDMDEFERMVNELMSENGIN